MPAHRVHAPDIDFAALRGELELPGDYPAQAQDEARDAVRSLRLPELDLTDVPFVTIDPPDARDLDQAMHLSTRGDGYRVRYAIADVATFVRPAGAIDTESRRRGQTVYFPDVRVPLHPVQLSEDAASLLAGQVRPAVVWTIDLDSSGEVTAVEVVRAAVRSVAQLDYDGVQADMDAGRLPEQLAPLESIGRLRAERAVRRGAIELNLPEQIVKGGQNGGWELGLRAAVPAEEYNAQISLLTGECAATIMLAGGIGLLRTLPPADPRDVARLKAAAEPLGVSWPDGAKPSEVIAKVDASDPRGAAFLDESSTLLRGAGYTAFDGTAPAQPYHAGVASNYAHVTAPLRRLADRYATEVCLALSAGSDVPDWARSALTELPKMMERSDRIAREADRAVLELAEATVLAGRIGDEFDAAVIEIGEDSATVVIENPVVRAKCLGNGMALGSRVRVRLTEADPAKRRVMFASIQAASE